MGKELNLSTEGSTVIFASEEDIWDILTNPEKIKLYMFGSVASTSWQPGSTVTFTRVYNGIQYQDKGQILEIIEGKLLKFTYWSSQEGYDDIPQNYSVITYTLEIKNSSCYTLKYCREKIPLEFERKNQGKFIPGMLEHIKNLAEQE